MRRYNPTEIERKWVEAWEREGLYRASDDPTDERPPFYALDMFPYPSGDLHMGHAEAFSGGDVVARFMAMRGNNVLHPIGWDAFGLPAENAAISRGTPPAEWTYANIDQQRRSFKRMGMSFDWSRQFNTCDPEYYRWTQWLFLRFFERGLASIVTSLSEPSPQPSTPSVQTCTKSSWPLISPLMYGELQVSSAAAAAENITAISRTSQASSGRIE